MRRTHRTPSHHSNTPLPAAPSDAQSSTDSLKGVTEKSRSSTSRRSSRQHQKSRSSVPASGKLNIEPSDTATIPTALPDTSQQRQGDVRRRSVSKETAMQKDESPILSPSTKDDLEKLRGAVKAAQERTHTDPRSLDAISPKSSISRQGFADVSTSPSLDLAFGSPATGSQSTTSTESARTIRGGFSATPSLYEGRTPSYPFPYIPRKFSSGSIIRSAHQALTTPSPNPENVGSSPSKSTVRDRFLSQSSTPGGPTLPAFGLANSGGPPEGCERFVSDIAEPDLYDIVLQLNCEPTLGAWWESLASVMNTHYGVHRMSLSLPADPSDQNVPWAQKASFDVGGIKEHFTQSLSVSASSSRGSDSYRLSQPPKSSSAVDSPSLEKRPGGLKRPNLELRHSYSGYESMKAPSESTENIKRELPNLRPKFSRSTSYTSASYNSGTMQPIKETSSDNSARESADEQEPELRSVDNMQSVIYPTLRALDREQDQLLDSAGVSRVIDKSKLVILTRSYMIDSPGETSDATSKASSDTQGTSSSERDEPKEKRRKPKAPSSQRKTGREIDSKRPTKPLMAATANLKSESKYPAKLRPAYEDYEQYSASPWSHSPGPSPAIQQDPEVNPFFATVNEETFSPTPSNQDYSHLSQVEAIGVDKSSTIVHIPLVHPLLSRDMNLDKENKSFTEARRASIVSDKGRKSSSGAKKLPIAILSIMSHYVPYPHHLLQSLKFLGPHLATSFHTSHQNTTIQERIAGAVQRQQLLGRTSTLVDLPPEVLPLGMGLESLLQFTPDENSSTFGSIASPSDYSSRSRYSPVGSALATPNIALDVSSQSGKFGTVEASGQPLDPPGDYFDSKRRIAYSRSKSGNIPSRAQLTSSSAPRSSSSEHRSILRQLDSVGASGSGSTSGDKSAPSNSKDAKASLAARDDKIADSPTKRRAVRPDTPTEGLESRHSLLHSHGADFSASFQSLPVTAAMPRTPSAATHSRNTSTSEAFDMPPPSERLLRTIIDSLPVQIFTAAPFTGDVTWVNSKYLVYRGQTAREVLDDPWSAIHPDDLDDYLLEWRRSLHTGQQFQYKVRIRRFDNNFRWYFVRAAPLRDKLQNLVHWVGTMVDLHDQHVAEMNAAHQQETAASEAKYRALANSSPQIVFAATRKRGIIFCNRQWIAYSGQSEDQAKGIGFTEYVHPDDLVKCQLPTFDEDGDTTGNVPTSMPPEPHRTWSGFASISSEESGESSYTLTGIRPSPNPNITLPQRKLSELASTGILRVTKDPTGKASYSTEVRLRMKSGEYRWHLVRVLLAEPIIQAENEEETWYGTCTDINDHKELEQTLKETMDAKSRFLSNMSHEIRTPLNGIHGMATFLIDSNLTPEQLDQVNIIRASTEGLRDLINDILDLSKVEAGMITLTMDWFHMRSTIEEVNDLTFPLAVDKDIELNYLVEDTVPFVVKGDKFRFRQVLLNVIGNAIKFTNEGEVFVRCRVASYSPKQDEHEDRTYLQIDVIDTGAGFSEKEAERLFKRFSQIDGSSTRQHGGSGLGLVISMQLVELHGGTMTATSVPMKGSTFTFTMRFGLPENSTSPASVLSERKTERNTTSRTSQVAPYRNLQKEARASGTSPQAARFTEALQESPGAMFSSGLREKESGSSHSSASSDPSVAATARTSSHSTSSSHSSYIPGTSSKMALHLPTGEPSAISHDQRRISSDGTSLSVPSISRKAGLNVSSPPLYSILVVCPLKWTREAVTAHLESVLTKDIPHNIISRGSMVEAQGLLFGEHTITFTHVILILRDAGLAGHTVDKILKIPSSPTSTVVISDMVQRKEIISQLSKYDFDNLMEEGRVQFVSKPIKPSKLAPIFDPTMSRELSTDHNLQSAQQMAENQKQVFDNMSRRLGNKNIRALLVEDNKINQMVMLKLLRRVSVDVDTVLDGVQATDAVFSHPVGYYSIILLDLMMPNKDGYQTCRDIREWELENKYAPIPIIALSANVLNDAWQKCKDAGFNSYLTKPVEFSELSDVMTAFLDPEDPSKPLEFMRNRSSIGSASSSAGGGLKQR